MRIKKVGSLVLAAMLVLQFSSPIENLQLPATRQFASLSAGLCAEVFTPKSDPAVQLAQILEQLSFDSSDPRIQKFFRQVGKKAELGRLTVRSFVSKAVEARARKGRARDGFVSSMQPSAYVDRYIERQVAEHGLIKTLEKIGKLKRSTPLEQIRLLNQQYNLAGTVRSILFTGATFWLTGGLGPAFMTAVLTLPPIPFLKSRPLPLEILERAIAEGDESVSDEIGGLYRGYGEAEAVQAWLRLSIQVVFLVVAAEILGPYLNLAISTIIGISEQDIEDAKNRLGLDERVRIQVENWSAAYHQFQGREPTATERADQTARFRRILQTQTPATPL